MNVIIRQIIDADKEAREAVAAAKAEKEQAQQLLTSQRESIYAELMAESQKEIDHKKAELAKVFEAEKKNSEAKYEASLASLEHLFAEKKDEWIQTIVNSCLA